MPQADILSFHPTLLFLPFSFLGGYLVFLTWGVPRLLLTLKARAWLTQTERFSVGALFLPAGGSWPELFLMFVQFGGLLFFLSRLTLVDTSGYPGLSPLRVNPRVTPTFELSGGLPVENFFLLWGAHREEFLFRPAGAELTHLVDRLLGGFAFFAPGKQFPHLGRRLQSRLSQEALKLSAPHEEGHRVSQ